jgi:hypothetical protein
MFKRSGKKTKVKDVKRRPREKTDYKIKKCK